MGSGVRFPPGKACFRIFIDDDDDDEGPGLGRDSASTPEMLKILFV